MMKDIPVDKLQQILNDFVDSGKECGLQLTIYQGGQLAADLCAGFTDSSRTQKVTADSLFPIFSSGKAVMTTAFLMLWEEYGFSFQDKVSKYWHEFVGSGKENTEIHHVLSHRTGLHMLPGVPATSDQLADWDFMCAKLCAATPKWTPGTTCGYQGMTFAWLLGELAYRISGIPFKKYIEDKILIPLGIENNFFFGTIGVETQVVSISQCFVVNGYSETVQNAAVEIQLAILANFLCHIAGGDEQTIQQMDVSVLTSNITLDNFLVEDVSALNGGGHLGMIEQIIHVFVSH